MTAQTKDEPVAELMQLVERYGSSCSLDGQWGVSKDMQKDLAAVEAFARAALEPAVPEGWQLVPVVPNGWRLVPIEPTIEMCESGRDAELFAPTARSCLLVYRAMLKAAPPAPKETP